MECSPRHSQLLYIPATHYSPPVINLFLTLVTLWLLTVAVSLLLCWICAACLPCADKEPWSNVRFNRLSGRPRNVNKADDRVQPVSRRHATSLVYAPGDAGVIAFLYYDNYVTSTLNCKWWQFIISSFNY